MGLLTALLYLLILGVGGVGHIPLALTCTPVTTAMSIMAVGPATLDSAVAPVPAVVVTVSFASVMLPHVRLGTPTSSTAILILSS